MATVVGQTVGTAVGGPIGGIVGGLIGSAIDLFLANELFPPDDPEGPKLEDLQLQTQSEGSPVNVCLGPRTKVAGTIVWAPVEAVREIESPNAESGGKGGPDVPPPMDTIRDVAIVFARRRPDQGPVSKVERLWFDGQLVYVDDPNVDLTSTAIAAERIAIFAAPDDTVETIFRLRLTSDTTAGGVDLSQLRPGRDVAISGFSASGNNGGKRCISSSLDSGTGVSEAVFVAGFDVADEAAGNSIDLLQVNPKFDPAVFQNVTFYLGSGTQTADPTMESFEGVGNVPPHRHFVYAVFEGMNVTATGGRPPQVQALVEEASSKTLAEAIADVIRDAAVTVPGLVGEIEFDTSALSGDLLGNVSRGVTTTAQRLAQYLIAFDLVAPDMDGVLTFKPRTGLDTVALEEGDLGANEDGRSGDRPALFEESPDPDLPKKIVVQFDDDRNELQKGAGEYQRPNTTVGTVEQLRFPFTLVKETGRCIATRMVWQRVAARHDVSFPLPPSKLALLEGDLATFPGIGGLTHTVLVDRVEQTRLFGLMVKSRLEDQTPATLTDADCPVVPQDEVEEDYYVPPELDLFVLQLRPLASEHEEQFGFYWCTAAFDADAIYRGASLYESVDGGSTFQRLDSPTFEGTIGRATTELGAATGPIIDRASTVTVELLHGTLSSVSLASMLAGQNRAVVGNEVIGWTTSTQNGDGTWTLGGAMLRGLQGTEGWIDTHTDTDRFVHLNAVGIEFQPLNLSAFGTARSYKAVPSSGTESEFDAQQSPTIAGATLSPFSPYAVTGARDSSTGDLTISWLRRTRAVWSVLSDAPPPLLEESAVYDVEVLNGSTVVRTFSAVSGSGDAGTQLYTATQQTTDFGSAQASVDVRVYQRSGSVGRGEPREATV